MLVDLSVFGRPLRFCGVSIMLAPTWVSRLRLYVCMIRTCDKTISVPDDVVPIIDSLGVPFSTWVADQLRYHAATHSGVGLSQQLLADAVLAGIEPPTAAESLKAMERSAPW